MVLKEWDDLEAYEVEIGIALLHYSSRCEHSANVDVERLKKGLNTDSLLGSSPTRRSPLSWH